MSIRRKIFYGFTLVVLAVLLVLPTTGWLARMQLLPFAQVSALQSMVASVQGGATADTEAARFVAARPDDFDMQYAYAMTGGTEESLLRLDVLDKKFPNNPDIIAARLTRMAGGPVKINRAEENVLSPASRQPKEPVSVPTPSDPATVAKFIALAEQGERVAPTDAFFSTMVAIGNFARSHDDEAVAAWKRAGAKPDWNDSMLAEMNAKWKLQIARNGGSEVGFMPRAASMAAILFPHYASIRGAARLATVKAIEAEIAGNRDEGVALRGATRHIGAVMMTQSDSLIGVLVGRAVTAIASSRPGGAEAIDTSTYTQAEKDSNRAGREREAKYVAYLRSVGRPEEATAFQASSRDGDAIKEIGKEGMNHTYMGFNDKTWRLMACWYGDILLLAGVLASLTFAGIFKLIYKFSPRLQKSEPLQTSARWGVMLGLVLPILGGVGALATNGFWSENQLDVWVPSDIVCGAVIIAGALLLAVPPIVSRLSVKSIGHGLLVMLATASTFVVIAGVGAATWFMFAGPIGAIGLLQGLSGSDGDGEVVTKNIWVILLPAIVSMVMLSLPVVLLGVFAAFSRMLRIPVAAGVTRGMRAMAVPLACVMILGWSVCLFSTLKHENAAIAEMKRFAQIGEPRMQAEVLGKTYPAMTEGLRIP